MATINESRYTSVTAVDVPDTIAFKATAIAPIRVVNCGRLGMQANPPSPQWSFGWFRRR